MTEKEKIMTNAEKVIALEWRVTRLEYALTYYGNAKNYHGNGIMWGTRVGPIVLEEGQLARRIMKEGGKDG